MARPLGFQGQKLEVNKFYLAYQSSAVQPGAGKYYSIILFWNHGTNEFVGYYINFQLPFREAIVE